MKLSQTEFARLARAHKTADDHLKLAAHFRAHAADHESDAKLHEEIAGHASGHHAMEANLASEARHYAAHSREAAEAMRNMAKIHEQLATDHK